MKSPLSAAVLLTASCYTIFGIDVSGTVMSVVDAPLATRTLADGILICCPRPRRESYAFCGVSSGRVRSRTNIPFAARKEARGG
uniref:Putative secreted protein n=1 Tax=Anopheles darlingi TaxID=43151 RepID=A0A2M4D6W6_ANODA